MSINKENYLVVAKKLKAKNVQLVAVSKLQPVADLQEMYNLGQRDFGENYVQELVDKKEQLPADVRWHFIGHLQRNKVKYVAPFVHLIQGVDSFLLLKEINKEAHKAGRKINCLLQVHIAREETKFGLSETELEAIIMAYTNTPALLQHVNICGLMGMASFTDDSKKVAKEMMHLKTLFDKYQAVFGAEYLASRQDNKQQITDNGQQTMDDIQQITLNSKLTSGSLSSSILSMGMSGDYEMAIAHGSNMVRIGSLLFGARPSKG